MTSILSDPTVYFIFSPLLAFLYPLLITIMATTTLLLLLTLLMITLHHDTAISTLLENLVVQESDELDENEKGVLISDDQALGEPPHYEIGVGSPTFEGGLIPDDGGFEFLRRKKRSMRKKWRSTLTCILEEEEEEHDVGGSDGSVGGVEGIGVADEDDEQVDYGRLICCLGMPGFLKISKAAKASSIDPGHAPVYRNVYDLKPAMNGYLYWAGLGIFHSGVEVHGVEYGYEGHDLPTTGVYAVEPHQCPGFKFRKSIFIGTTNLDPKQVEELMERHAASSYSGDSYHLIAKNCNHFCKDVCRMLTGRKIPKWVNRLAKIGSTCNCILPQTLKVTTIEKDRMRARRRKA